jgi:hypothetical protein
MRMMKGKILAKHLEEARRRKITGNWSVSQIEEYLAEYHGYYPITYITKGDLEDYEVDENTRFNVDKITSEMMSGLANKMGEAYTGCCYWDSIQYLGELLEFPTIKINQ